VPTSQRLFGMRRRAYMGKKKRRPPADKPVPAPRTAKASPPPHEPAKPVQVVAEPANLAESKAHHKRSPILGQLMTVVAFSALTVALDCAVTPMPWYSAYAVGGYSLAQARLLERAKPNAVVVDLDALVPLRDRRSAPTVAGDPEWGRVAASWKQLGRTVQSLQQNGARAIMVDWELALKDDYLGIDDFYDPAKIPVAAQKSYDSLLKTLVKVDRLGCPVVIGADWINESANAERRKDPKRWFPVHDASRLAVSLAPAQERQGFDEVAYAASGANGPLPPASQIIASRLEDRLRGPAPFGFSPFAEAEGSEQGRPFWIDHSTVDPKTRDPAEVNGKIVVIASTSDMGSRTDAESVPGLGQRPGGFYHAAAIGTRVGRPLYSFANVWAEYAWVFLLNLVFGLIAIGLTQFVVKIKQLEHHTPNVYFIEFWMESLASLGAAVFLIWLAGAVPVTRLLLPGISAVLAVRVLEPAFALVRFRKLVTRWKEPEH